MKWSILICTLPNRAQLFKSLTQKLHGQIGALGLADQVEVLSFLDNKEHTVGHKRNVLMERSQAEYSCFIDDDDDVSDWYVERIYGGLLTNPDCVSLTGIFTRRGRHPQTFIHSLDYTSYFEEDRIFYRPPNHLNPVRRELVKQVQFPELNHGEDSNWAMTVCKKQLLRTEFKIDDPYYFYRFDSQKSETFRHMNRT